MQTWHQRLCQCHRHGYARLCLGLHAYCTLGYLLLVPLKTGVNLHLAICGTDVLLCQQRKLGVPAPRERIVPGYLIA